MSVIIKEIASDLNFVKEYAGECITTFEFDMNDSLGIIGCILSLISEKENIEVYYVE